MKIKQCTRLLALAALLCGASAYAQPGLQCGTATLGQNESGSIVCGYLGTGSTATGGQFDLGIGTAGITITSFVCATGFTCPAVAADPSTVVFLDLSLQEVQDNASAVTVNFDVATPAFADYTLTVSNEQYSADGITPIAPVGTTNGTITVQDGPGPGVLNVQPATLGLMADVNAPAGTGVITISNDGVAGDATITPSCSLGAITGAGTITVTAAPASLAPGANGTVTASCSGSAVGMSTADYSCTAGAATITNGTAAITCDIATGTPNPNPAGGTAASINIGPVVRGSSGVGGLTFTETNNSGGSYSVTCALTDDGGGAFTINSAAAATVDAATPFAFQVAGTSSGMDPQPTGVATCTYGAGATGAVTIALGIALIPEIVPTMTEWGLIILTLALVGFGAFQLRRRAPLA